MGGDGVHVVHSGRPAATCVRACPLLLNLRLNRLPQRSVRAYLEWSPAQRDSVLAAEHHQPLADERATAYYELLHHDVPRASAAAVNDVVPWVLRRTRNERGQVRAEVRGRARGLGDVWLEAWPPGLKAW